MRLAELWLLSPPNYNTWQIWNTLKQSGEFQYKSHSQNRIKGIFTNVPWKIPPNILEESTKNKVSGVQWCPFHDTKTPACSWGHLHHSKASNLKGFSSKSTGVSENRGGFSPQIIHSERVFHYKTIHCWGIPILGNTHIIYYVSLFSICLWNKSFEVATPMLV